MVYDITTSGAAITWLLQALDIDFSELIAAYFSKGHRDVDGFIEKYSEKIKAIDITDLEIIALHITTNSDNCATIKELGILDLQQILMIDSELTSFLEEFNIKIDVVERKMTVHDDIFDIDFDKYQDWAKTLAPQEKALKNIGHKLYCDYQINGFLFINNTMNYSTIFEYPEFLYTLSTLGQCMNGALKSWEDGKECFVVKYKVPFEQFAEYTFHGNENDYYHDAQQGWIALKTRLATYAVLRSFLDLTADKYVYIKPSVCIHPDQIIECVPLNVWKKRFSC